MKKSKSESIAEERSARDQEKRAIHNLINASKKATHEAMRVDFLAIDIIFLLMKNKNIFFQKKVKNQSLSHKIF